MSGEPLRLEPGDTFYHRQSYLDTHGRVCVRPYKCHVLAVVENEHVVYKWWAKSRRSWTYEVKWAGLLRTEHLRTQEMDSEK